MPHFCLFGCCCRENNATGCQKRLREKVDFEFVNYTVGECIFGYKMRAPVRRPREKFEC
jgi:hypothetical protein